jgi:hypothetical protein
MNAQLGHHAELIVINVAIRAMDLTSRSSLLSRIFRKTYHVTRDGNLVLWSGVIAASGIAGFLIGYLAFFASLR